MRILWLKTELLHPVDKGGKIRSYQILKELIREHRVTYMALDDGTATSDARERATEYCHELICIPHRRRRNFTNGFYAEVAFNLLSRLPFAVARYDSAEMRDRLEALTSEGRFDVVVCDFLAPAVNLPSRLSCPIVLFQHNVEAVLWKRRAELQDGLLTRTYLLGQWRKMRAFEGRTCRRVDQVIAVSPEDADMMRHDYDVLAVDDAPTGVDSAFFRPRGVELRQPLNLVFTGSMDWTPNADAIGWFTSAIMPLIRDALPGVTLTVVGRSPHSALVKRSEQDPSLVVTGRVDDVRPYIERAAAYVVPLRIGGGTRLKIYEAMAMEKPIISTTIGAEGLPVEPGKHLLLADTPATFASAVVRVLTDERLAADLGRQSGAFVREHFGWSRVARRFAEICENAANVELSLAGQALENAATGIAGVDLP